MAIVHINLFSESLMRTVNVLAILPVDKRGYTGECYEGEPLKTLYLLHGIYGSESDWLVNTEIAQYAQERNLAVIMPAGENRFYIDNPRMNDRFSNFIGVELVDFTRKLFPLSKKREDTYIGGLSMGGYGALINGLRFHGTFSHIGILSGALILNDVYHSSYETENYIENRGFYETVFGNIPELKNSEWDYEYLALKLKEERKDIPKMYFAIGKEDFLYNNTMQLCDLYRKNGIQFEKEEGEGGHDWKFWNQYIISFLEWLPLQYEEYQGISSGNVK